MIFITHRLPEVLAICDRATVLRDGRVAAEIAREDFDEERFISAMSGQRLQRLYPTHEAPVGTPAVLRVSNVSRRRTSRRHSERDGRQLHASRRRDPRSRRTARFRPHRDPRRDLRPASLLAARSRSAAARSAIRSTRDARHAGIALLTEDRKRYGLLFNLPVGGNITIGNLGPLLDERHHQRRPRRGRSASARCASSTSRRASPSGVGRASLRRQPAEAALRPRADERAEDPAARRADQGRRCRHPPRDLPADRRSRRQAAWRWSSSPRSSRR